jgi:hypothetical protein
MAKLSRTGNLKRYLLYRCIARTALKKFREKFYRKQSDLFSRFGDRWLHTFVKICENSFNHKFSVWLKKTILLDNWGEQVEPRFKGVWVL